MYATAVTRSRFLSRQVAPYLTSFMTEEQASGTLARVLQGLAIVLAGATPPAAGGPQANADAPPPPPVDSGGSAAAAASATSLEQSSKAAAATAAASEEAAPAAPYVPRWAAAMAAPLPEDPAAAQEAKLRQAQLESQQAQAREVALRQQQQRGGLIGGNGAPSEGGSSSSSLVPPLCDTVFSMAFGGRTLLARTRLHLERGRRYGLVGANGAGKRRRASVRSCFAVALLFSPPPPPRCISFYSLPCVRNVGCSCIFKREIHAPAEPCCASHRGFAPILTCGSGAARGGQLGASWKCLRGGRSITRGGLRSRDRSRWQKRRDGDSALAGVWKRR